MNKILKRNEFGCFNYETVIDSIYKIVLKECGDSKYIIEFKEVNFFSKDTVYFTEIILTEKLSDATRIGFEKLIQFFVSSPKFKIGFEHWNELRIDAISDAVFYENSNTKNS